jgi:hypothetical protein
MNRTSKADLTAGGCGNPVGPAKRMSEWPPWGRKSVKKQRKWQLIALIYPIWAKALKEPPKVDK